MIRDLPLDAIEAVNNAGVFSAPYNAWAALRNLELMLPVTAGGDARLVRRQRGHPLRGHDSAAVRRALLAAARARRRLLVDRRQAPFHLALRSVPPIDFSGAIGNASVWELCPDGAAL
jgi:hypothetical protein